MWNKTIAAAVALMLTGLAWADKPIGQGTTPHGTGSNAADTSADAPSASHTDREYAISKRKEDANPGGARKASSPVADPPQSTPSQDPTGRDRGAGAVGQVEGVEIRPEKAIDP